MSGAAVRVGVGTRLKYDGEVTVVEEMVASAAAIEEEEVAKVRERVAHMNEVLTGFRSGSGELSARG